MKTVRSNPEFLHQVSLFNWAELVRSTYPELRLMRGSMNGVYLSPAQAGKAKAAGMKKGEPDVMLPVRRGRYSGISIELKYGENTPTREQLDYGKMLEDQGWYVTYSWDWQEAAAIIQKYLDGKL